MLSRSIARRVPFAVGSCCRRRLQCASLQIAAASSAAEQDAQRPIEQSGGEGEPSAQRSFAGMYPDFLPTRQWDRRNALAEKIERREMLRRRTRIAIPEFYVGSILGITCSDKFAPGRRTRFVGLCIERGGEGLRSQAVLRNCVDGMGVEVTYDLYNPAVRQVPVPDDVKVWDCPQVDVLRLRRHPDPHMLYIRDALPEYYTIDPNMEPEPVQPGAPVQTSDMKVILKNPPWCQRWEMYDLQGLDKEDVWNKTTAWYKRRYIRSPLFPHLKYDLILDYRMHAPAEEQRDILRHMEEYERRDRVGDTLARDRRRWLFPKPHAPSRRGEA